MEVIVQNKLTRFYGSRCISLKFGALLPINIQIVNGNGKNATNLWSKMSLLSRGS